MPNTHYAYEPEYLKAQTKALSHKFQLYSQFMACPDDTIPPRNRKESEDEKIQKESNRKATGKQKMRDNKTDFFIFLHHRQREKRLAQKKHTKNSNAAVPPNKAEKITCGQTFAFLKQNNP